MNNSGTEGKSRKMPKPKNGAGRNLKAAIAVGVGLGALVLLAICFSPLSWYLLVSAALGIGTLEVLHRLSEKGFYIPGPILLVGGQAMIWLSWPLGTYGILAGYATTILIMVFFRLFFTGPDENRENYVQDTSASIFVLTWIALFGSFAAMLSTMEAQDVTGTYFIVTFMLCVIASDVGGYITGIFFGSHPMAPRVSPKKSWEGFTGSMIFGITTGILTVHFLLKHQWWLGVLLGVGFVVCATLGDLVESQFKRDLNIKDMSNLLPGHGGLMDRLDGMLPAAVVSWLIFSIINST